MFYSYEEREIVIGTHVLQLRRTRNGNWNTHFTITQRTRYGIWNTHVTVTHTEQDLLIWRHITHSKRNGKLETPFTETTEREMVIGTHVLQYEQNKKL